MPDYRAQAYAWAPDHTAAINAAASRLHYNESLDLHKLGEENTQHGACSYCWLRAGRAVRALIDAGLLQPDPASNDREAPQ